MLDFANYKILNDRNTDIEVKNRIILDNLNHWFRE